MNIPEFLEVYPRDLTTDQVYNGATDPHIQAAQLYSYGYGQILYDALKGERVGLTERANELAAYQNYVDFGNLEVEMLKGGPELWKYRNQVNFFGLNRHMSSMWRPLISGEGWKHNEHRTESAISQGNLALDGLVYYKYREAYLQDKGEEAFDNEAVHTVFTRLEGALQETDGTIALMNWAQKYPNLTVVPAPAQFEHSTSNAGENANADLLVIDMEKQRAIGVQIKTQASERTRKRYDQERIVIIDSEDLRNVRAWEGKGSQAKEHRPWPGIIAVSRVAGIQTKNTNAQRHGTEGMVTTIHKKMEAKAVLGNLRVDYTNVARSIGAKVLEKL